MASEHAAAAMVRPMRADDVADAERLSDAAFVELDRRALPRAEPDPEPRDEGRRTTWRHRVAHLLRTDPEGCWVAELDGAMVGFAVSYRRDTTWLLASYAVRPGLQRQGIGTALLGAALRHGRHCLRGMLSASDDPTATRLYRRSGFDLHPQMTLSGTPDLAAMPDVGHVREARGSTDLEMVDSLTRRLRGAGRGPDLTLLAETYRLSVVDRASAQGFAATGDRGPQIVAATDRRTAALLLWESLAQRPGRAVQVGHVTGANQWALDVAVGARLAIGHSGFLGLRGLRPPSPYVHQGALL